MSSLRARLTVSTLVGTLAPLLIAGILLERIVENQLQESLDSALEAKAETLIALTEQEGSEVLVEFAEVYLLNLTRRELIEIRLDDGRSLVDPKGLGQGSLVLDDRKSMVPRFRDLVLPGGHPGRQVQIDFLPLLEGDAGAVLAVAAPPEAAGQNPGRRLISVAVAIDSSETLARIRSFRWTLGLGSVALLAILAVLVPWLVGRGLQPLVELGLAVQKMEATNLGTPLHVQRAPVELEPLLARLDDLRRRLARSFERERRFSSDVAHELRTPIAELRNLGEVAVRFPPEGADSVSFYRDVLATARRMEHVAGQLLALARLEESSAAPRLLAVSLPTAVREALERQAPGESCRLDVPAAAEVLTNPTLFELLLDNLIANAFGHRSPGTPVAITATGSSGGWRLTCSNATTVLDQADLEHLFDRFWRKDDARTGFGHSGLGLALVRSIAQTLGIAIEVALDDGIFAISLQLAAPR